MEKEIKERIRNQIIRSVFLSIVPFVAPIIIFEIIPDDIINATGKIVIMILVMCIDIYFVLKYAKEDAVNLCKYQEIKHDKKKYRISQSILNRVSNCEKIKGALIKDETYKVHYDYKDNILLYNPHRYLERVCEELKSLISDITGIELEYISVSFIYQYPYEQKSNEWTGWKWITGKDPTSRMDLKELINIKDSYYHYLIANDEAATFENDKARLIPNRYNMGEKDKRHNEYGSISAHKMSFRNNNQIFCAGYLTISTYGKKFYSSLYEDNVFESVQEFEQVLFDLVIPPFRKIIETELGFLYLRHKYQADDLKERQRHKK